MPKYYFCNIDFAKHLTGIERSSIQRANLFVEHLNIVPQMLTLKLNLDSHVVWEEYKLAGLVNHNIPLVNMYDDLLKISEGAHLPATSLIFSNGWNVLDVENIKVPHQKIYHPNGVMRMYIVWRDVKKTIPYYINYFVNKKKARRDKFNRYGQLAVTQYLGEKECVLKEDCYTPSGLFCISRVFDANTRKLNLIQWFDHASGECFIFYKEEELAGEWLKRRFFDEGNIFFIDKHRSWSKPLNDLNKVIPQRIISVIHSIHISDPYEDVKEGRLNSNYRNILNSTIPVERCIVLTPHQKEDIHHRFKDTSYKLNCIPHSLTIPNIFPIFEERDPNLLVAAIRLSKEKRIEDMLHIMRLVSEYHPEKRLEIYGEGPDKKKIQALIKELEIENFVIVKGYRQDIDKIFSRAAISLLTSRIEGFSLATLESLAQGCPVLSYDIKYGPASMIIHEHNGWLIENGNIESAAKILISIFNTPQKLKAISRNAYVSTRKFSSELIASRWASVLGLVQ